MIDDAGRTVEVTGDHAGGSKAVRDNGRFENLHTVAGWIDQIVGETRCGNKRQGIGGQ